MRRCLRWIIFSFAFLSACRTPTPVPLPAKEIILRSIARLEETSGFHFVIDRSGAPAFLDAESTLSLRRMEGDFVAPDRIRATVRVIAPGFISDVQVISIGGTQWQTIPLSNEWQQLPPDWGFNPAMLFDPAIGLEPILENDLEGLESLGHVELEELPGQRLYAISGRVQGDRIYEITYGLIGPDMMDMTLWIFPETFELYRMVITENAQAEQEKTIWTLDFWDYDQQVEIQPPLVEGESIQ
jgi:hypothetical protein